jgi:predicted GIY-YIG superfamily endonuclease
MGVSDVVVSRSRALLTELSIGEARAMRDADARAVVVDRVDRAAAPPLARLRATLTAAAASLPELARGRHLEDVAVVVGTVGRDEIPPPAAAAWSCVYVLRRDDGWAYVGETDDLAGRLEAHRATARREKGGGVECAFASVPREAGGKSTARALEARAIRALADANVPLLSASDARNVSFGSARRR